MQRTMRILVAAFLVASPTMVLAHGSADMLLESTASGGGQLRVEFDFGTVARVGFSHVWGTAAEYRRFLNDWRSKLLPSRSHVVQTPVDFEEYRSSDPDVARSGVVQGGRHGMLDGPA